MGKEIFVVGGTGFIGSHLIEALVEEGNNVTCLINREESAYKAFENLKDSRLSMCITTYIGDLQDYDEVYYVAGILGKRGIPIREYNFAHITLPSILLSKMMPHQHFLYMSTGWVKYPTKPYQQTKLIGEKVVRESGIPYTIIRPSFVYGARDYHHLPLFQMIKKMGRYFPIIGNGKNKISPTYFKDVIRNIIKPPKAEFYIAGKAITMNEFIVAIAKAVGVRQPTIHIPYPNWLQRLSGNLIRDKLKAEFFTKEAVFETQGNCTPLGIGLEETIAWYKKYNLL